MGEAVPLVISAQLRAAAAEDPDLEALVDGDVRLTFGELSRRVDDVARAFIAAGLRPGETVGLWAPNSATWVLTALGVLAAGGILVPLNSRFKGTEAHFILGKSRARMLIVDDGFLDNRYVDMLRGVEAAAESPRPERPVPSLPELRTVVSFGDIADGTIVPYADFLARGAGVDPAEVDARVTAIKPGDVCDIVFTSGTTGRPKGVMTAHRANVLASRAWAEGVGLRRGDRYLIINPLFHSFGYRAGLMACVLLRATMYPVARFDVDTALRLASAERISVLPGPPTLFHSILDHSDLARFDLSALRLVVTGAATVPAALMHRLWSELPGIEWVVSPYGLTECGGTATLCPIGTDMATLTTSVGQAIPGTEVAIMDTRGTLLPPRQPGEVVVRGYNVMLGYLDEPEATAEAIDAHGWLHTGDMGYLDERGFLYLTGRLKEVFQTGGFNVYPVEVEQLLLTHPEIAEAAVVGVPDARLGEVGHAYVVARPGTQPTPESVIAFARERIANFKVPRYVTVVDSLPRNAMGKIQKFRLGSPSAGGD
ncbi:MAG: AMP-binding protein [Micromonosporaceae bacterium]|nr:AMP-binding protein [Micromonosporaceae bacterium]